MVSIQHQWRGCVHVYLFDSARNYSIAVPTQLPTGAAAYTEQREAEERPTIDIRSQITCCSNLITAV